MKALVFVVLVLVSGALAGLVHGTANLILAEPFLDEAIYLENQNLLDSGGAKDTAEFWIQYDTFREWQKSGQMIAGAVLGVSFAALFGIVYAYSRESLPGTHDVKKSLILAGIMWAVLFVVPFLKYPASLPGSGNGDDVAVRGILYVGFIAISGFGALAFYRISRMLLARRKLVALAGYAALMGAAFFAMPGGNADMAGLPSGEFQIMSILAVSMFWLALSLIFGTLWHIFRPDRHVHPYAS